MSDYFALFSLAPKFDLDDALLEQAYFGAQRKYHPDRFTGKPDAERQLALQQSMLVNDAYQVLKSPLKRAQYLLSREGIRVNTESDTIKPSQALLTEVMELREQFAETKDREGVEDLHEWLSDTISKLTQAIAKAFDEREFAKAGDMVLRLNYLTKLADDVRLQLTRPAA